MVRKAGAAALSAGVMLVLAGVADAQSTTAPAGDPQPRALCADRPGKATPPCILDAGRWRLEVGALDAAIQHDGGVKDDVYAVGQFELRAGVTRRTEIEIGWTPWSVERQSDALGHSRQSGVGDLSLGFRTALTDPDASGLAVSLEPFVTAPTATRHQGAGGWAGGLLLPMAGALTDTLGFGFTPEVDVVRDAAGGGQHLNWSTAVGLSRAIGPATLGVELWGARDLDPAAATTQASLDATVAWVPPRRPDLQLDGGVNAGLTHSTPDVEAYVGVTRRF